MTKPFAALLQKLRPITLPKCDWRPWTWLRQLELTGCDSVLINTHYLAEEVEAFLKSWQSPTMSVKIVHEPELLGTAGTLQANQAFFRNATGLLIHADNAMAGNLKDFLAAHRQRQSYCKLTMLTFNTNTPSIVDSIN